MAAGISDSRRDYSFIDRLVHRMAFAHPVLQRALGEIESDLFADRFAAQSAERPVFVTGLPRAGTTLLLEMLYKTGEFAAFTYREMPFLLAPLFWSSVTRSARKDGTMRERAHGDGLEISFDSPEAFEEVAWLAYLGDRYVEEKRLLPLDENAISSEFRNAFPTLARKLSAAQSAPGESKRYLSKNNANISRIPALRSIFPDAALFVCVRKPHSHIRSMMTQHQRFSALHDDDAFARDYMKWIGHFDFGANFRPIDFTGRQTSAEEASSPDFWLTYWIDAYTFARRFSNDVHFVCYEKLFEDAQRLLGHIADAANLGNRAGFIANAADIRKATTADQPLDGASPALIAEASDLYESLAKLSI